MIDKLTSIRPFEHCYRIRRSKIVEKIVQQQFSPGKFAFEKVVKENDSRD